LRTELIVDKNSLVSNTFAPVLIAAKIKTHLKWVWWRSYIIGLRQFTTIYKIFKKIATAARMLNGSALARQSPSVAQDRKIKNPKQN